jgi:hypothetical protein
MKEPQKSDNQEEVQKADNKDLKLVKVKVKTKIKGCNGAWLKGP